MANIALTPTWLIEINELAAPIFEEGTTDNAFSCINGRKKAPAILWMIIGQRRAILKLNVVLSQASKANIKINARVWKQNILLYIWGLFKWLVNFLKSNEHVKYGIIGTSW